MHAASDDRKAGTEPHQAHFNHLLASGRHRPRSWTSATTLLSMTIHATLFGAAAYATAGAVVAEARTQEIVTYLEVEERVEEQEPEPPRPEPERVAPQEQPPSEPPPPLGTQTLTAPTEAPPEIPQVDLNVAAVNAADFSGLGVVGGTASGVAAAQAIEPPAPEAGFAYELEVLDRAPQLVNGATIATALKRLYPPMLERAGLGGTVVLQFVVEPDGTVDMSSVRVLDAPHEQLGAASVQAIERLEFRPGRFRGQNVRVWIRMPITWQPPR